MATCLLLLAASCRQANENMQTVTAAHETEEELTSEELIKRGDYLVHVIGCGDCHTPKKMTPDGPVPDMDRFLSGFDASRPLGEYDKNTASKGQWVLFNGELTAAAGPWGVSYAANLTPDETGLGNWTFDNFRKALTEGRYKGIDAARPLLPPMPWQNLKNLSEEDLKAMFEYLKTIKPVMNRVPPAELAHS